ncbi:hypothetical protein J1605_017419 [Eschrichtius robustus]|uniref:Uncharacterized protein n=1 Tax=Eschrichtius robustus TaxID=9764 RepID=A0AB34HZU4_ESCRO|nr:hypothetical protein J1605_017419 [Eschrichtius robustus]
MLNFQGGIMTGDEKASGVKGDGRKDLAVRRCHTSHQPQPLAMAALSYFLPLLALPQLLFMSQAPEPCPDVPSTELGWNLGRLKEKFWSHAAQKRSLARSDITFLLQLGEPRPVFTQDLFPQKLKVPEKNSARHLVGLPPKSPLLDGIESVTGPGGARGRRDQRRLSKNGPRRQARRPQTPVGRLCTREQPHVSSGVPGVTSFKLATRHPARATPRLGHLRAARDRSPRGREVPVCLGLSKGRRPPLQASSPGQGTRARPEPRRRCGVAGPEPRAAPPAALTERGHRAGLEEQAVPAAARLQQDAALPRGLQPPEQPQPFAQSHGRAARRRGSTRSRDFQEFHFAPTPPPGTGSSPAPRRPPPRRLLCARARRPGQMVTGTCPTGLQDGCGVGGAERSGSNAQGQL